MKFGFLVCTPTEKQNCKNLGDYVQSLAARQFYPHVDEYVHRENISEFQSKDGHPVKVITNAWWMWNPKKWPPSKDIIALPVSMHISPYCAEDMLNEEGVKWFKTNEPIGCRDYGTVNLLESKGIKAYFTGCLTLTLYRSYPPVSPEKKTGVCFADPYISLRSGLWNNLKAVLHVLRAPYTIYSLTRKDFFSRISYNNTKKATNFFHVLRKASLFHEQYSNKFTNKTLREADYVSNMYDLANNRDDETLIAETEKLLRFYNTRKLVVTSRIHVALPCTAMETPVIFIKHPDIVGSNWNANRLGGLIDFFHCMDLSFNGLTTEDDVLSAVSKISSNYILSNKETWRPFAKLLDNLCVDFCKKE